MRRLQTHGDFQMNGRNPRRPMALERLQKAIDARPDERWMRFDDDSLEACKVRCYSRVVAFGYGSRGEAARGVVELHLRYWLIASSKFVTSSFDLSRYRTGRCFRDDGSSPQVAHHTAPRTLSPR